ncbi:Solute carrier organic anion transporter family member 4C1 [Hypsibius exemplaris]|uniref:tRNA (guanine-N(7)-)-methyltransferase non-catalytic subunit n=1 Tax=Hypsibius exemplaris TaxID=2072580 RepID=A0A1W0WJL9_HYPEX|nr:Solute carrier organic anion transporter family member 4C1 [Hypsibius exemplaris]
MHLSVSGAVVVVALADKLIVGTNDSLRATSEVNSPASVASTSPLASVIVVKRDDYAAEDLAEPSAEEFPLATENAPGAASKPKSKLAAPHNVGLAANRPDILNAKWFSAVAVSPSGTFVAAADNLKTLFVFKVSDGNGTLSGKPELVLKQKLAKRSMALTFSADEKTIIVADKLGDAYRFAVVDEPGTEPNLPILGHISVLTDVLLSPDQKFILTADCDEKVRVSHYPLADDIQSFCLGHTRFVTKLLIPTHDHSVVLSGSGDGTIRAFNYLSGDEIGSVSLTNSTKPAESHSAMNGVVALAYHAPSQTVVASLSELNEILGYKIQFTTSPDGQPADVKFYPAFSLPLPSAVLSFGFLSICDTLIVLQRDSTHPLTIISGFSAAVKQPNAELAKAERNSLTEVLLSELGELQKRPEGLDGLFREPFADLFSPTSRQPVAEDEADDAADGSENGRSKKAKSDGKNGMLLTLSNFAGSVAGFSFSCEAPDYDEVRNFLLHRVMQSPTSPSTGSLSQQTVEDVFTKVSRRNLDGFKDGWVGRREGPGFGKVWEQMRSLGILTRMAAEVQPHDRMSHSYTSSMIPSIEKRFGFSSKATGIILSMNDVTHVSLSLITAHFGGSGHRPRWISFGCFLLGLSLILHAAPEIFFPLKAITSKFSSASTATAGNELLCSAKRAATWNASSDIQADMCTDKDSHIGPLVVFGVSHLMMGAGSTTLMILGLPFIDDNSDKQNTPIYFAISFSARIFGPVLGFILGSYCNSIFLDWTDPGFSQTDPRWISAWYLGYLFTGMGLCIFALTMGCFPASIPRPAKKTTTDCQPTHKNPKPSIKQSEISLAESSEKAVTWQDLPRNLKRLLVNGAFMCRACSQMLEGLVIAGYMSFLPKFIGQQFKVSPSEASLAGGVPSVLAVALGVVCGGFLIRRFRPEPRHIALGLTLAACLMSSTYYGVIGLGCEKTTIYGFGSDEQTRTERAQLAVRNASCPSAQSCGCPETEFRPVCHRASGINYYSACHAGCRTALHFNGSKRYHDCSCVTEVATSPLESRSNSTKEVVDADQILVGGLCPKKCPNLYIFIAVMFIALFATGLPLSGSFMVQYRIVDPDLKSLATGFSTLLMSAFGFLPGPILAGAIVDSTCKLWQVKSCGEKGFCLIYDTDDLRWKLHLVIGSVKLVQALLDILMTWKVWDVKFEKQEVEPVSGVTSLPSSRASSPMPPQPAVLAGLESISHDGTILSRTFDDRLSRMLSDEDEETASKV